MLSIKPHWRRAQFKNTMKTKQNKKKWHKIIRKDKISENNSHSKNLFPNFAFYKISIYKTSSLLAKNNKQNSLHKIPAMNLICESSLNSPSWDFWASRRLTEPCRIRACFQSQGLTWERDVFRVICVLRTSYILRFPHQIISLLLCKLKEISKTRERGRKHLLFIIWILAMNALVPEQISGCRATKG